MKVVGVRFKKTGKIYYFSPEDQEYENQEKVIVKTSRGIEYATVVIANKDVEEKDLVAPLKPILRKATPEDEKAHEKNKQDAQEACKVFQEKTAKHKLEMKLLDCEYTFDRTKLIFYFTAEGRIDFRELVRDLAAVFKTRIELRQIGVRDEAKIVGGIGPCGRGFCCKTWLGDFLPVSIKMAKDQSLSLNPSKISGVCGRLFCCLKYENETYEELLKIAPTKDSMVLTPEGKGKVVETYLLQEQVKVQLQNKDESEIKIFHMKDLKILKRARQVDTETISKEEIEELEGK